MLQGLVLPQTSYLERKQKELELLSRWAHCSFSPIQGTEDLVQQKFVLREKIRAHFAPHPYLGVTNLTNKKSIRYQKFRFQYSYQRSGLRLKNQDHFSTLYVGQKLKREAQSFGLVVRSGQTATYVTLSCLKLLLGPHHVSQKDKELYFETKYLLKLNAPKNTDSSDPHPGRVFFLDSSTEEQGSLDLTKINLKTYDFVVIDTTCYSMGSREVSAYVDHVLKAKRPCILVRSHMKLDTLATEYGLLGSLVLIYGNDLDKQRKAQSKKLKKMLFEMCQIQGGFATLSQIWPFYHDSEFHLLNERRIQIMQENNQKLAELLRARVEQKRATQFWSFLKFHSFKHNLFFWLEFDRKLRVQDLKSLGRALSFAGVPYKFAESFGFDFMSLSVFPNVAKRTTLRVSMSDMDPAHIKVCERIIIFWLEKLAKSLGELPHA